jgi:hypothetical protein
MSEERVTVYPTSENACVLVHPIDGHLSTDGSPWTRDGFTARCLVDGAITVDKAQGWKSKKQVDLSKPPPHATQVEETPPATVVATDSPPETKVVKR